MLNFLKQDRSLGVARKKRHYDLPLNKSPGTGFIILLIALMTFLGMMALAGSFVLSGMSDRWTSGLENQLTIEIPAEDKNGKSRSRDEMKNLVSKMAAALRLNKDVKSIDILSEQDIIKLISPWLGDELDFDDIPLPGLISFELNKSSSSQESKTLDILRRDIRKTVPNARLDTHEEWLNDLLKFTSSLQFVAFLITLIIGITTATAVAGAGAL